MMPGLGRVPLCALGALGGAGGAGERRKLLVLFVGVLPIIYVQDWKYLAITEGGRDRKVRLGTRGLLLEGDCLLSL